MRIKLAYGREGLWIDLPDDAPVTVIEPRFVPGLPDERTAIIQALRAPRGTPPLRDLAGRDDTVAIVFSDLTRPMPNDRALPPLLDELAAAGVPAEQVVLINALATHRPQTEAELRGMLGDGIVDRYRVIQHEARSDDDNLVPVATNHAGRPVRVHRGQVEPAEPRERIVRYHGIHVPPPRTGEEPTIRAPEWPALTTGHCCAVIGSIVVRISVTLLAGNPLSRACSCTASSLSAR